MSDGISDMYHEQRLEKGAEELLGQVLAYLKDPSPGALRAVIHSENAVRVITNGGWAFRNLEVSERMEYIVRRLESRDPDHWIKWLAMAAHYPRLYESFKGISPFAGSGILTATYGIYYEIAYTGGDAHDFLNRLVRGTEPDASCKHFAIIILAHVLEALKESAIVLRIEHDREG